MDKQGSSVKTQNYTKKNHIEIPELKITITKIKNSLGFNRRFKQKKKKNQKT